MQPIYYILLTLFLVLSLFLILLVLIQKGRGGGLASAFGGVGGNTAFGAKTGDVLTWATSIVFAVFIILAIGLNLIANRIHERAIEPRRENAIEEMQSDATGNAKPELTGAIPTTAPTTTPAVAPAVTPASQPASQPAAQPASAPAAVPASQP
jgi:preprotein translocase subunit SecG